MFSRGGTIIIFMAVNIQRFDQTEITAIRLCVALNCYRSCLMNYELSAIIFVAIFITARKIGQHAIGSMDSLFGGKQQQS